MKSTLAIVICAACVIVPNVAAAKPKIALTEFTNDTGDEVRDAISDALDNGDMTVIGAKEVNRAYDKLKIEDELSEKDAKKLAKTLEADAIIHGKLGHEGGSRTLHLQVFVHGKKAKGFTVSFGNVKSEKFKTQVRDKLVAKIGVDDSGDGDAAATKKKKPTDDDDDALATAGSKKKARKTASADDGDADGDVKPTKKKHGDAAADDGDADGDEAPHHKKKRVARGDADAEVDASDEVAVPGAAHAANRAAVRLDAGVSIANRSLEFTSRANFAQAPKKYTNAPVPGARVDGELYPLAFANPKSAAAGLGLGFDFDQTLSLTLHTATETAVPVKTTQRHWEVGPRFRIAFGSTPTSPTMTLGVGYGKRTFKTDRTLLADPNELDLPDTDYTIVDPSITFRIPLAPAVALSFGGQALFVTDAGPITTGDSYGRAKVYGGSGTAALDIILGNRFAIRLAGEFTQLGFTFTGGGAMTNNRDMDPTTIDIGGATDRSFGGAATLGVLY